MVDLLDQSEVDALLDAASLGSELETPADVASAEEKPQERVILKNRAANADNVEVRTYDFKRPERVSKDQIRALQTLHEAFGRNLGASMSAFLRTIVEVKVSSVEQLTYQEFIHALPNPTVFNLLSCEPLTGQMCLEISPLIVYPIVDRLLGGGQQQAYIPKRPITEIELSLIYKVTDRIETCLNEAWENVVPLRFSLDETESNPHLVQIVPPNEVVVNITFDLKIASQNGTVSLCAPFNMLEPVMEKLISQSWNAYGQGKSDGFLRRNVVERLSQAPMAVSSILAETQITMEDLLSLEPGSVIMTDHPADSAVMVDVGGKKKYLAQLGQFEGKRAIRLERAVTPRDLS